ncbi:hypothetical protein B0H10DRAFT_1977850 [Mycena sp. CBHHK59/15]|nr:hypothetical protein B0H10DRAFT_1977850 [Mycena sp. CBHHK59/15]
MSQRDFPWYIFSANTLRPMVQDVLRSTGDSSRRLNKEDSLNLLRNIEKHGLDAALKGFSDQSNASPSTSKRKHEEPDEKETISAEPKRKRGRPKAKEPSDKPDTTDVQNAPASPRKGRSSDPGPGLLTRRQAAQTRGENVSQTRSWKPVTRSPRKAPKASKKVSDGSVDVSPPQSAAKPKSKGQVFDGVELLKRPESSVGKGKEKAGSETQVEGEDQEDGSDEDAEGEIIEDGIEVETSSLENSTKENDRTFLDIANAYDSMDAEGDDLVPPKEIGSPAPQITIELVADQIEEARNTTSMEIGSPAPEIMIESTADEETLLDQNGHTEHGDLLRPRIHTRALSVELNPEYIIEVFSPTSAQHDSDDEMWVPGGVNGSSSESLRAASGGLGPLDSLD